jgi:hypothetical protein
MTKVLRILLAEFALRSGRSRCRLCTRLGTLDRSMPLLASCSPEAQIPEPLRKLVERKCGNCHSETVEWPSYSPLMRLGPARSLCRSFAAAIEMVRYRNCGRLGRSRAVRTRASPKSNVTASARATLKTQSLTAETRRDSTFPAATAD